jgi:dephospho-CoA kinase
MIKVGITGGIGSGKTTICDYIKDMGLFVIHTDIEANKMANINPFLKDELIYTFGDESYIDGIYNRKYIASIVFSDPEKLEKLNRIYKKYMDDFYAKTFKTFESIFDIIFVESALIFEHNQEDIFDAIICVYTEENVVRERLKKRNNLTDEEISQRIDSQMPTYKKMRMSDYVIDNTKEFDKNILEDIIQQIIQEMK